MPNVITLNTSKSCLCDWCKGKTIATHRIYETLTQWTHSACEKHLKEYFPKDAE